MRLAGVAVFFMLLMPAAAQHEGAAGAEGHGAQMHGQNTDLWKWANFLLLAGILGYYIGKNAGPFFAARSKQIRKDMVEAQEVRADAEARAADVERRLANLEAEIAALRAEAQQEQSAEEERARRQTAAEIAKIQHNAEQEIAAAGKSARIELKHYSAKLALGLAEQKIRGRITPETQDSLVRGFASGLTAPAPRERN